MRLRPLSAADGPAVQGSYPGAVEVSGATRWLFLSGQIPADAAGAVAPDFEDQCVRAWANVEAQLRAADMTLDNLVKVTTYLADRADAEINRAVRLRVLDGRQPALTVIITDLFEPGWRVEIEAIAAA
jgi:2-iminobutanoate/2-iminopropanoate deaminase